MPLNEGTQWSYQSFDKKGKLTSTIDQKISASSNSGSAKQATVQQSIKDNKGKSVNNSEYNITCDGGKISVSIEKMMNQEMMASFEGMEINVDAEDLDYYSNLSVGQSLKDASMTIDVSASGTETPMSFLKLTVYITNRKVETKETITTDAGTFECYKITYDTEMQTIMKIKTKAVEWFCPGVGMVKQETYSKNGKLTGSTKLSSLVKG